jgi:hypothetical protein
MNPVQGHLDQVIREAIEALPVRSCVIDGGGEGLRRQWACRVQFDPRSRHQRPGDFMRFPFA